MKKKQPVIIGLAGFGVVGYGLYQAILKNQDWIVRRLGREIIIKKIFVRNPKKYENKVENNKIFTTDYNDLIDDAEINIIVELLGGTDTAYELINAAFSAGKNVVTANKALLALRGDQLFATATQNNCAIYYEAAVCAGIPVVQTLKESLAGNRVLRLAGILNGTANYILSEMTNKNLSFASALQEAQRLGFAEADPTFDVEGIDAAHKLCILIRLAYGCNFSMKDILVHGISNVAAEDIANAKLFGYTLKLIGQVGKEGNNLIASVVPVLIRQDHILGKVDGPFNAILILGDIVGPIMLYGQGAGDFPTASAVLADIMSLASEKAINNTGFLEQILPKGQVLSAAQARSPHYLRVEVEDNAGVLAKLCYILGENNISIAQAIQIQPEGQKFVPIVFLTHKAKNEDINCAMAEIEALDVVKQSVVHYQIFDN